MHTDGPGVLADTLPSLLLAAVAAGCVQAAGMAFAPDGPLSLVVLATTGTIVYIALHMSLRTREWRTITGKLLPKALAMVTLKRNAR